MDLDEIRRLLDTLIEKNIAEFEIEEAGTRLRVRRGGEMATAPVPGAHAPATAAASSVAAGAAAAGSDEDAGLVTVRSPIVGTYYESPAPGAPEFVRAGDRVETGQVLCIIEAMKLMNEIEAEMTGTIARKLATNGQPVEYGQALLMIRPA